MLHRKNWAGLTILLLTCSLWIVAHSAHAQAPLPPPTTDGTVSFKVNCGSDRSATATAATTSNH